jgi:hypothetical protein
MREAGKEVMPGAMGTTKYICCSGGMKRKLETEKRMAVVALAR